MSNILPRKLRLGGRRSGIYLGFRGKVDRIIRVFISKLETTVVPNEEQAYQWRLFINGCIDQQRALVSSTCRVNPATLAHVLLYIPFSNGHCCASSLPSSCVQHDVVGREPWLYSVGHNENLSVFPFFQTADLPHENKPGYDSTLWDGQYDQTNPNATI